MRTLSEGDQDTIGGDSVGMGGGGVAPVDVDDGDALASLQVPDDLDEGTQDVLIGLQGAR